MAELPLVEAEFRAMGSSCRVVCDLDDAALFGAVHRIEDLERRWSRFLGDSEVSRVNRGAGEWVEVSAITEMLVDRAVRAAGLTAGLFDPLMLVRLEELGYDRTFSEVRRAGPARSHEPGAIGGPSRADAARIELGGGAVRLPAETRFDPGGLGKGLSADLVCRDLLEAGATWILVSLGGDMRFGGSALARSGWRVTVENPLDPGSVIDEIPVRSGAVATSSVLRRQWPVLGGGSVHHIIDPRTDEPSLTRRATATVVADEAWWADVVAKVLLIDDEIDTAQVDAWNTSAMIVDRDGSVRELGSRLRQPILN